MIRRAEAEDAEPVARVHVRAWQEAYAHIFPAGELASLSVERRAEVFRRFPPLVAVVDGAVVGFVGVGASRDDDAGGEVYAIYVCPAHWGKGIGRELIRAAEEELRDLGYGDAILWVLDDNPRARRFYEAAGWWLDGETRTGEHLGVETREVRYRKRLADTPATAKV
jgi:GNAT superfamily N-acetyltransferase